jgi:hypothetical protein
MPAQGIHGRQSENHIANGLEPDHQYIFHVL